MSGNETKPRALRFSPGDRVTLHDAGHGLHPYLDGEEATVVAAMPEFFLGSPPRYRVQTDLAAGYAFAAVLEDEMAAA